MNEIVIGVPIVVGGARRDKETESPAVAPGYSGQPDANVSMTHTSIAGGSALHAPTTNKETS